MGILSCVYALYNITSLLWQIMISKTYCNIVKMLFQNHSLTTTNACAQKNVQSMFFDAQKPSGSSLDMYICIHVRDKGIYSRGI